MIPLNSVSEILIQVKPLAGARRALSSELGHEPADRRVGAGEPPLLDEPIVDALGGVPLLARGGEVLVEHLLDPGPVAFETGPLPGPPDGGDGRHVLHVGVLAHGVAADVEPSGNLGPRDTVGVHRPYIIPDVQGHGHFLHPSRAVSPKYPPGKTYGEGRAPGPRGAALLIKLLNS